MAERTGSRARRPPPVPKARRDGTVPPPIPTSADSETATDGVALDEPTQNGAAAAVRSSVDDVFELLVNEAEALLTGASGADRDELVADLNLRLALLADDLRGDADGAARYLELAEGHPFVHVMLRDRALGAASAEELDRVQDDAEERCPPGERAALARDLAEAWLYRWNQPVRAAEVGRAALDAGAGEWAGDLGHLLALALTAEERWDELESLLAERGAEGAAAALAFDRLGDAARAVELLGGCHDATGELGLFVSELEQELEIALEGEGIDGADAIERRIALLEEDGGDELAALRYQLAERGIRAGNGAAAGEQLEALLASPDAAWGRLLVRLTLLRVAQGRGDWDEVAAQLRALADGAASAPLSISYERRVAQILAHRLDAGEPANDTWRLLLERVPDDAEAARAVEVGVLGDDQALLAHLERLAERTPARAESRRRAAAAVAESRVGDLERAARLAAAAGAGAPDLARLARRRGDRARVATVYRGHAEQAADDRVAAPLLFLAGAIELSAGRLAEAEDCFRSAAARAPADVGARAVLASLYRAAGKQDLLLVVLGELVDLAQHEVARFDALRELGEVATSLGDAQSARDAFERALELRPDDASILHALAVLYDARKDWSRSIDLRERAVGVLGNAPEAVSILMEIGSLEEQRRQDRAAALDAYERACAADPTSLGALHACQRLYREQERPAELLRALRAERDLVDDTERHRELGLEIARVAEGSDEDTDAILDAYRGALAADADDATALAGIERVAAAAGRWDAIIEAFSAARETASHVGILANAYREQGDWKQFAEVRLRHIALTTDKATKVELANELALVYERELADEGAAVETYKKALTHDRANRHAQRELARLLESGGRWRELASAIEEELRTWSSAHQERQIELLLRLGGIRRNELSRSSEAALAYEAVLERDPDHGEALEALEALYRQLGRDRDLLRILESRRRLAEEASSELLCQIAELEERLGNIDGTVAAYLAAFEAEPQNREIFTALEKLCYQHERWSDVMTLYKRAIDEVEAGRLRAYRLGDLYARRGQVQFQYLAELGESAASYLRVVELDPDDESAIEVLETIFTQQSDWSSLIAAHEKRALLTTEPARKLGSLRRAALVARTKSGDQDEAARVYRRILDVEPGDREAIDALERHYRGLQEWKLLVEVLETQLEQQPADDADTSLDLLERIAKVSEEGLRDEERAVRYYQRILEADEGHRHALDALSRIFESTERWGEFVDVTRKLVKVTKDRNVKALLYFKCGSVMEAKFGKEEDAIRYYDAAIKTSPACLPAVHGLRDLHLRRKDWPRVIQTLELEVKLWQDDKERAGVFAQIGRIYADELDQPDRAMHYYESALAVDPDCVPANKALFEQYFEQKQWDRAQPLAQALAQKAMRDGDPTARSEFYRKRGIVARFSGDPSGAAESIIIALEIKPNNLAALEALIELASSNPQAYDFPATFRELDKIYRKRDDSQPLLARVMVAQAFEKTREGDLDVAQQLFSGALDRSPTDFAIVSSLIDLHISMRSWDQAVQVIEDYLGSGSATPALQIEALMRLAEIHADGEMDSARAVEVLTRVVALEPSDPEAHYRLAQELYCLGRFDEARRAIQRVIELSAAPGTSVSPERLSRYYYYLGRIIESSGDSRAAASQYRRAAEYDPGYGPPALALAKRAVAAGDQPTAETLLINAAHAAMEQGDEHSAVPLQRGLARILLAAGDRAAAIEAYRGILAVESDPADRFALAEIYADHDLTKAIQEVQRVIETDLRHAPAYRMLASFYRRANETVRAARVYSAMEILGYADPQDRQEAASWRAMVAPAPLRNPIDLDLRATLLLTPAFGGPMGELFVQASRELTMLFPQPPLGEDLAPLQSVDDPTFLSAVSDVGRLFGIEPEIYLGSGVPRGMVALSHPRPIVVVDRGILGESDAARRFLLGYAFDAVRGGYALLLSLGQRQRSELGTLMRSLFLPESERSTPTNDFVRGLPEPALEVLRRHEGACQEVDSDDWIEGMIASARRAGLVACDDFSAAVRVIGILGGEANSVGAEGTALGTVLCGEDLFRFYVGDEYHRLREHLTRVAAPGMA